MIMIASKCFFINQIMFSRKDFFEFHFFMIVISVSDLELWRRILFICLIAFKFLDIDIWLSI